MTPNRNILRSALALCLLLCLGLTLAACREQGSSDPTVDTALQVTYELQVMSQGGAGLGEITVYIYADDTLQDMVAFAKTDKDGKASFTYKEGSYVAVLTGVPQGYTLEKCYPITGENTVITLPMELVEGDISTSSYRLGDVMQDFTFTDASGQEHKLSQLLQEKSAVVLNFWYLSCNPCRMEFPFLEEAYAQYADQVAVLAMNPVENDDPAIAAFGQELGLTFPVGSCDPAWANAFAIASYPTTVVIDRFGTVALIHEGSVPNTRTFTDVFAFFTAEDYVQTTVTDIAQLLVTPPDEDEVNNPTDISGTLQFEITLKPGQIHFANIHWVTNAWLQIKNSDVYVEYNGKTYQPANGTVGLTISAPSTFEPAVVGFGNSGQETVTFTVNLSFRQGTYENPYQLQLGAFSASVAAGNDQGVYFTYKAKEDGYLKLQCLGVSPAVAYNFTVQNLNGNGFYNVDGQGGSSDAVSVPMNGGETVRISIAAMPDETNNYPAAKFNMQAEFSAQEIEDVVQVETLTYAVTVTDENRNPIPGVTVNLVGTLPEPTEPVTVDPETTEPDATEPETTEPGPFRGILATDENGVAQGKLPKDTYTATVIVPDGYTANTTTFQLTPEVPYVSLKMDTYVLIEQTYVVRVVNEAGEPVPGALITIGNSYGRTDADGVYSVTLEKADYTVTIGAPEGYTVESPVVPFPAGGNALGITLKAATGEQTGTTYKVQVVDVLQTAQPEVLVSFYQNGVPMAMVTTDETGTVTANLEPGRYILSLTSADGKALKYDQAQAIVTKDITQLTVTVYADANASGRVSAYWGYYYPVFEGGSWATMKTSANYVEDYGCYMYAFAPENSGIYRFSISQGAVLTYYGTVQFPNPSLNTDNEQGYFEITVMDSEFENDNQPTLVLGVAPAEGVQEAAVTVIRVADAPEPLPVIVYEPTCPQSLFVPSGTVTKTYVDLTQDITIEKGADGFYYLNGKKLYMNLSKGAPRITLSDMVGLIYTGAAQDNGWGNSTMGTGMKGVVYEDGVAVAMEDFTECIKSYIRLSDPQSGLYPLNDDLIHMVQSCGDYMGWWEEDHPNNLFVDVEDLNSQIAWMFAVCTID